MFISFIFLALIEGVLEKEKKSKYEK